MYKWKKVNQMETKMNQVPHTEREPGLGCPRCGTFIRTTIVQLLTTRSFRCPRCLLELRLDSQGSGEALGVLKKVQDAHEKVQKASKFNH